jgi:hypothetical protein
LSRWWRRSSRDSWSTSIPPASALLDRRARRGGWDPSSWSREVQADRQRCGCCWWSRPRAASASGGAWSRECVRFARRAATCRWRSGPKSELSGAPRLRAGRLPAGGQRAPRKPGSRRPGLRDLGLDLWRRPQSPLSGSGSEATRDHAKPARARPPMVSQVGRRELEDFRRGGGLQGGHQRWRPTAPGTSMPSRRSRRQRR